jgi:hypothetical protein
MELSDPSGATLADRRAVGTINDDDDEDDDDDDAEEDEEQEVASAILVWNGGECELAIDVGLEDDRIYWQVNGDDVPTDDGALRESLKRAFAEEIGL